jgi:Arc/MetJ-type ribon-helix-helix transcriptional regulator
MSADTAPEDNDPMEKIDLWAPESLIESIEKEHERRGYASRSEAIRDALRDWLNPSPELSEQTPEALEESKEQRGKGETVSAAEARDRLGLDDE